MKKNPQLKYAPQIDLILERFDRFSAMRFGNEKETKNQKITADTKKLLQQLQSIKPEESGNDKIWNFWVKVPRGEIKDFGEYQEYKEAGEVKDQKEFEQLWKSYYPESDKWYKLVLVHYTSENHFFIHLGDLSLRIDLNKSTMSGTILDKEIESLISWVFIASQQQIAEIKKDPEQYNRQLEENLPFKKRLGKIKRSLLWGKFVDRFGFQEKLSSRKIQRFEKIVPEIRKERSIKKMTANDFYRFCEIGYDSNNYFKGKDKMLSPKEKYQRQADGRDEGLGEIDLDNPKAFEDWFHNRSIGGHPWEVCRGGNATHISLYVHNEKGQWSLILDGGIIIRVEETVNFALGLHKYNIPFRLNNARGISKMLKGEDFIGLVPEDVIPKYCSGLFPKEDEIIDYFNPWMGEDNELTEFISKKAFWYPLDPVKLQD